MADEIVVTSYNQTGGITAYAVIIGAPERHLTGELQAELDRLMPAQKQIIVISDGGDGEAMRFADEIGGYFASQRRNSRRRRLMPWPFGRGQTLTDYPDRYELVIGPR